MRKVLAILLALALVTLVAVPVVADVITNVKVTTGGGQTPVVKCKWETPDDDPDKAGTQKDPSCAYNVSVFLKIWAVVADFEDQGFVSQVVANVFHPEGPPEEGSIKYNNVELTVVDKFTVGIPEFEAANTAGLITYTEGHTYTSVWEQLDQCEAEVWCAEIELHYHQPCGDYKVEVYCLDHHGNVSDPLENTFEYVCTDCIEIDFSSVDYGEVIISSHIWKGGDTSFGTADKPTVRNVGNCDVTLNITQDDMMFGQYSSGEYKVEYDARLGPSTSGDTTVVQYDPYQTVTLPNKLPLCNTQKLDFSIHVKIATVGNYTGEMVITCDPTTFGP
jgi:hypothetical protein